jgi:hypothetical protein
MNALSGYIELSLGDEVLPFKFGTNAWALFCDMRKIEFGDIANSGIFGKYEDGKVIKGPDFIALRDLYYCAYQAAVRAKDEVVKLNIERFTDLLDDTQDAIFKLQEVMIKAKIMGYNLTELSKEGKPENF